MAPDERVKILAFVRDWTAFMRGDGPPMAAVAREFDMRPQSVRYHLDKLSEDGLLDISDIARQGVQLTPAGEREVATWSRVVRGYDSE